MSEAQKKEKGGQVDSPEAAGKGAGPPPNENGTTEEAVKPFYDASRKYLEAIVSAQEAAVKDALQAHLEFQQAARQIDQEAYDGVMEATKDHLDRMSEQTEGGVEQTYLARAQSQFEYESEVRRVYADAQAKLSDTVQSAARPEERDLGKRFTALQENAYEEYVADLQRAWSSGSALDPEAMKAIAANILCTLQAEPR